MTTAIIGIGNIGGPLARHLVAGGKRVIVAARNETKAAELAKRLGALAAAAAVSEAIARAEVVVFAVPFDAIKELVSAHSSLLEGKVIIDPSNPVRVDEKGNIVRTLPDGQSSGSMIAGLLPRNAHHVKAFGDHGAPSLGSNANRQPERMAFFYATDDSRAASTAETLIVAAGFDAVKVGDVQTAGRIEVGGDLHEYGGLQGKTLSKREATQLVTGK